MFTPIRNLITYLQKNASGSTFFGGSPSNTELSDTTTTMESELNKRNDIIHSTNSLVDEKNFHENSESNETKDKQIHSTNVLVNKKNLNENNNVTNENTILDENNPFVSVYTNPDPLQENNAYHDNNDDLQSQEEDEEKDIFLDFPHETVNDVDFPVNEVIVLNDPELNISMNSEPSADPLAIDDYNAHLAVHSPNPLDSSTDGDVLFVVDIEEVVGQAPLLIDEVEESRQMTAVKSTDEQELRSDGSDSGLGSETSTLQTTVTSVTDTSVGSIMCALPHAERHPLRSNLKRHIQDVAVDGGGQQLQKKPRKSINFDGVKVFYFPRIQGHGCVPSQGGCTLGMGAHHISFKTYSLAEHAAELRRAHKLQLQEINPRSSSTEESDSDEELSEGSGSDFDAETNGFLQPVSPKQRRALLKAAGIRKIDVNEKIECRDIRNSREVCGCVCRDFCDPDTCACSQAGIKCQVDRAMFPCGCSRDACGNAIGRIEFNPARVRTHFIHTIMRLDMENRQQKRTDELSSQLVASTSHLIYDNVPALANSSTTAISTYNPMPGYGLDQNSTEVYHHHMHQQYNVYNNHMPPTHPASGLCSQMPPSMVMIGASTTALPPPHNHLYANTTTTTEPESIALNGGNLHYQDESIYPPVIPPVVTYGDILAPYANTMPYENTHITNYSTSNLYTNYHNPHHGNNHIQPLEPFMGYSTACNGNNSDLSETHNSFISLNTPAASSSRLSAINDLLHNNRNTTAALIAVSPMEIKIVPCEAEQQCQMNNPGCGTSLENLDITRPETPPAEEPPTASTETINPVNKQLKNEENNIILNESIPEVTTNDTTKSELKRIESPQTEMLPANISDCKIDETETKTSLNSDSSKLLAELSAKVEESNIKNTESPLIVDTVSA